MHSGARRRGGTGSGEMGGAERGFSGRGTGAAASGDCRVGRYPQTLPCRGWSWVRPAHRCPGVTRPRTWTACPGSSAGAAAAWTQRHRGTIDRVTVTQRKATQHEKRWPLATHTHGRSLRCHVGEKSRMPTETLCSHLQPSEIAEWPPGAWRPV